MSATFLMSYPDANWQIRGGRNFRSQERTATSPRRAMREWLTLCDAILRAGGHVLVMPPPAAAPGAAGLTGLVYTANAGQLFHVGDSWVYLVSRMAVPHRVPERDPIRDFVKDAGIEVREAASVWEGQADLQHLGGNRWICTWGVRSERASLAEIHAILPPSSRVLDLELQEPFFHGDTCLNPLVNRSGDMVLLGHGAAFVEASGRLPAIRDSSAIAPRSCRSSTTTRSTTPATRCASTARCCCPRASPRRSGVTSSGAASPSRSSISPSCSARAAAARVAWSTTCAAWW